MATKINLRNATVCIHAAGYKDWLKMLDMASEVDAGGANITVVDKPFEVDRMEALIDLLSQVQPQRSQRAQRKKTR